MQRQPFPENIMAILQKVYMVMLQGEEYENQQTADRLYKPHHIFSSTGHGRSGNELH
jgi:hypothetical protein